MSVHRITILALLLFCQNIQAQNNSIKSIDWLVGKWNVKATEKASDGSSFLEKGYATCNWVKSNHVIACHQYVSRVESQGTYKKDIKREIITYYQYDAKNDVINVMHIRRLGSSEDPFTISNDGAVLKSTYERDRPDLQTSMTIESTIRKVNSNEFRWVEEIEFADNSLEERYESVAIRLVDEVE